MQGMSLQQSLSTSQFCPYSPQVGGYVGGSRGEEPSGAGAPSGSRPPSQVGVPPSVGGGGSVGVLHVPLVEPTGRTQVVPRQQSALIVQFLPDSTQTMTPPSGTLRQRRKPSSPSTQGTSWQQSDAEAHVSPPSRQLSPSPSQRGTPKGSSLQAL